MKLKKKLIIATSLVGIYFVGVNLFTKLNEEFDGAVISGSVAGNAFGLSIGDNKDFSQEDEETLRNICLKRRKGGININSNEAYEVGKPTNDMMMSLFYNTDLISTKVNNYNLWIGNKMGYIQNKNDDKIYTLSGEENKFFIDCFLKYHSEDEVKGIISNEF